MTMSGVQSDQLHDMSYEIIVLSSYHVTPLTDLPRLIDFENSESLKSNQTTSRCPAPSSTTSQVVVRDSEKLNDTTTCVETYTTRRYTR